VNDRARFVEITALPDFVSAIDPAARHAEFGIFQHRARIDQKPLAIELAVRIGDQTVMARTIVNLQHAHGMPAAAAEFQDGLFGRVFSLLLIAIIRDGEEIGGGQLLGVTHDNRLLAAQHGAERVLGPHL
jgi:hypothetical protein